MGRRKQSNIRNQSPNLTPSKSQIGQKHVLAVKRLSPQPMFKRTVLSQAQERVKLNPIRPLMGCVDQSLTDRLLRKYGWSIGQKVRSGPMIHRKHANDRSPVHAAMTLNLEVYLRMLRPILAMHQSRNSKSVTNGQTVKLARRLTNEYQIKIKQLYRDIQHYADKDQHTRLRSATSKDQQTTILSRSGKERLRESSENSRLELLTEQISIERLKQELMIHQNHSSEVRIKRYPEHTVERLFMTMNSVIRGNVLNRFRNQSWQTSHPLMQQHQSHEFTYTPSIHQHQSRIEYSSRIEHQASIQWLSVIRPLETSAVYKVTSMLMRDAVRLQTFTQTGLTNQMNALRLQQRLLSIGERVVRLNVQGRFLDNKFNTRSDLRRSVQSASRFGAFDLYIRQVQSNLIRHEETKFFKRLIQSMVRNQSNNAFSLQDASQQGLKREEQAVQWIVRQSTLQNLMTSMLARSGNVRWDAERQGHVRPVRNRRQHPFPMIQPGGYGDRGIIDSKRFIARTIYDDRPVNGNLRRRAPLLLRREQTLTDISLRKALVVMRRQENTSKTTARKQNQTLPDAPGRQLHFLPEVHRRQNQGIDLRLIPDYANQQRITHLLSNTNREIFTDLTNVLQRHIHHQIRQQQFISIHQRRTLINKQQNNLARVIENRIRNIQPERNPMDTLANVQSISHSEQRINYRVKSVTPVISSIEEQVIQTLKTQQRTMLQPRSTEQESRKHKQTVVLKQVKPNQVHGRTVFHMRLNSSLATLQDPKIEFNISHNNTNDHISLQQSQSQMTFRIDRPTADRALSQVERLTRRLNSTHLFIRPLNHQRWINRNESKTAMLSFLRTIRSGDRSSLIQENIQLAGTREGQQHIGTSAALLHQRKTAQHEKVQNKAGSSNSARQAVRMDVAIKPRLRQLQEEPVVERLQQAIKSVEHDLNQTKERWSAPAVNMQQLTDHMYKELSKRIRFEQQRRGR